MMLFERIDSFIAQDPNIGFTFVAANGQRTDLAIPIAQLGNLIAGLLKAASELPRSSAQTGNAHNCQVELAMAIGPQFEPVLVLRAGPVELNLADTEQAFQALLSDIQRIGTAPSGPTN